MNKCETCANRKFDEKWGEYKCLAFHRRLYEPMMACTAYEKKKKEEETK